jgi:TetR/AcrR family transcriptional regulator, transcriptional repressor for nem operon
MEPTTKDRLLDAGMAMLLSQGYNHLGIQELLESTGIPKGSFYHHFKSKEDFALQAVDRYMVNVHAGLDECLLDRTVPPLRRVRNFFEATRESYRSEGLLGCLLGGLGQELSGISETFRARIEQCLGEIAGRIAKCLEEAIARGDLPRGTNPRQLANLLVDCWEGAALRTRLLRDAAPLGAMLDFYFGAIPGAQRGQKSSRATPPRRTQRADRKLSPRPRRTPVRS